MMKHITAILITTGVISFILLILICAGLVGLFGFVDTDSMIPTYPIGSFSYTNPFDRTPEIGDVVLFKCYEFSKCPETYTWSIEHRLVKIEDGCYHFWGDNPAYIWDDPIHNPCLMRDEFVLQGVVYNYSFDERDGRPRFFTSFTSSVTSSFLKILSFSSSVR